MVEQGWGSQAQRRGRGEEEGRTVRPKQSQPNDKCGGGEKMTRGFNPITGRWNESIEKSVGKGRRDDLQRETVRRIQEMNKRQGKKS